MHVSEWRVSACALLGAFLEVGTTERANQGVAVFFFFLFYFFFLLFFSLAKEEYNQSFVFRMLCNILERDIGVSRDLVKNKKKNPQKG